MIADALDIGAIMMHAIGYTDLQTNCPRRPDKHVIDMATDIGDKYGIDPHYLQTLYHYGYDTPLELLGY